MIQATQQDRLPAGTTRECPPWWRPGNSLVRTDIDVETDMVESGAAVELKEEPLVDGGLPDAGAAVVAKKTNQNVPDEVKVHAYQKNRFGWPLTRSWEKACQLAPDFFARLARKTTFRWKFKTLKLLGEGDPLPRLAEIVRSLSGRCLQLS